MKLERYNLNTDNLQERKKKKNENPVYIKTSGGK